MKVIKTISINPDVWSEAQLRTDNVSGTIENLLNEWNSTVSIKENIKEKEKFQAELAKKAVEIEKIRSELEKFKKKEEKKIVFSNEK